MEIKQSPPLNTPPSNNWEGATTTNHSCKQLVSLIAPPSCGKTALIGRLRPYLLSQGYSVSINDKYRNDKYFLKAKASMEEAWNNPNYSPDGTTRMGFLLIDAKRNGKLLFQMQDGAGEDYFQIDNPNWMHFPAYIRNAYLDNELLITYLILFNEGMLLSEKAVFKNYFKKLGALIPKIRPKKDAVLFVNNMADVYIPENQPKDDKVLKGLRSRFDQFDEFYRELQIKGIRKSFLTFSAGEFSKLPNSNKEQWFHSQDFYPRKLQKKIEWSFSKSWF